MDGLAPGAKGIRQVVAGVGLFLNEPAGGLAQIRRALEPGPGGSRLDGRAPLLLRREQRPGERERDIGHAKNAELLRSLVEPSPWGG